MLSCFLVFSAFERERENENPSDISTVSTSSLVNTVLHKSIAYQTRQYNTYIYIHIFTCDKYVTLPVFKTVNVLTLTNRTYLDKTVVFSRLLKDVPACSMSYMESLESCKLSGVDEEQYKNETIRLVLEASNNLTK